MANQAPVAWRKEDEHLRIIANALNGVLDGRTNNAGSVTLTASTAATIVTDKRAGVDSVVHLMPKTANAAAEIGAGGLYISARGNGTFTITHASNAQTDRDFDYALLATGRGT